MRPRRPRQPPCPTCGRPMPRVPQAAPPAPGATAGPSDAERVLQVRAATEARIAAGSTGLRDALAGGVLEAAREGEHGRQLPLGETPAAEPVPMPDAFRQAMDALAARRRK